MGVPEDLKNESKPPETLRPVLVQRYAEPSKDFNRSLRSGVPLTIGEGVIIILQISVPPVDVSREVVLNSVVPVSWGPCLEYKIPGDKEIVLGRRASGGPPCEIVRDDDRSPLLQSGPEKLENQ